MNKFTLIGVILAAFSSAQSLAAERDRDFAFKCENGFELFFHQTDNLNKVVFMKDGKLISSFNNRKMETVISSSRMEVNNLSLSDFDVYAKMTEEERIASVVNNPQYTFIQERNLDDKEGYKASLGVYQTDRYTIFPCSKK